VPTIASVKPYTPLEIEGRDLYIREGCVGCHSQMIRPTRAETARYGDYSKAGEFVYDHPFLWGSKRTGPDLHRVGGKYPDSWHWRHLEDPRALEPRSNMPSFAFLLDAPLDTSLTARRMQVLRTLGHPYSDAEIANAERDALAEADRIAEKLRGAGVALDGAAARSEAIAVIAYLQSLGRAWKDAEAAAPAGGATAGAGGR
jgi:cytochrome c oxidase cbb3-type subunit I/II